MSSIGSQSFSHSPLRSCWGWRRAPGRSVSSNRRGRDAPLRARHQAAHTAVRDAAAVDRSGRGLPRQRVAGGRSGVLLYGRAHRPIRIAPSLLGAVALDMSSSILSPFYTPWRWRWSSMWIDTITITPAARSGTAVGSSVRGVLAVRSVIRASPLWFLLPSDLRALCRRARDNRTLVSDGRYVFAPQACRLTC